MLIFNFGFMAETVMVQSTIEKLKNAFMLWLSDREACLYVWVNYSTFTEYCSRNEDFREIKEHLKEHPNMKAKINVVNWINEWNKEDSKWYLERKNRKEFWNTLNIDWELNDNGKKTMIVEYKEADHSNYDENWDPIINPTHKASLNITDDELN